jgi:hypothetical protein
MPDCVGGGLGPRYVAPMHKAGVHVVAGILTLRCNRASNRWEQIWPQRNNQINPSTGRRLQPVHATTAA